MFGNMAFIIVLREVSDYMISVLEQNLLEFGVFGALLKFSILDRIIELVMLDRAD